MLIRHADIPRKSISKQTYWVLHLLERWTIWCSIEQITLLVPYTQLPVWLQKNDPDHLLKILIPRLLFQRFCIHECVLWQVAQVAIWETMLGSYWYWMCESSRTLWSVKWVTLAKDRLYSFMRLGLLFLDTFLSHEPLRLTNGFWNTVSHQKESKWLLDGDRRMLQFQSPRHFDVSWVPGSSPHPFDFLSLVDFLLPVMFAYPFFYPPNAVNPLVWWTHLLPPAFSLWSIVIQVLAFFLTSSCHLG